MSRLPSGWNLSLKRAMKFTLRASSFFKMSLAFVFVGPILFSCNRVEAARISSPWMSMTLPFMPTFTGKQQIPVFYYTFFNHGINFKEETITYTSPWNQANKPKEWPAVKPTEQENLNLVAVERSTNMFLGPAYSSKRDELEHGSYADFVIKVAEISGAGDLLVDPTDIDRILLIARTTITSRCQQNLNKCSDINAYTETRVDGSGVLKVPVTGSEVFPNVTRGTAVGDPPSFGFTASYFLNLSPSGDPDSYQQAYNIELSSDPLTNNMVADISLGPLPGQSRAFDTELSYAGLSCLITAASPSCSSSFVANLVAGIANPSKWSFDPSTGLRYANEDLELPLVIALNPLNHADATGVAFYQLGLGSGANDLEVPVPGPLPIFGAMTALGWSRRLRKRIESSSPRDCIQ